MLLAFIFPRCMYLADFGISKSTEHASKLQELGILAGQIPTAIKTGGTQRMLRRHIAGESFGSWVSWFAPQQLSQHTLILGNKEPASSLLGLDLFWLALRSAFYHFSEGIDSSFRHPSLLGGDYAALSVRLKERICNSAFALSKCQMHIHPRGLYSCEEDSQAVKSIENARAENPLARAELDRGTVALHIRAVIRDTMLTSASWMFGRKLSGMDLYDSCIVILVLHGTSIAIPSARVLMDTLPSQRVRQSLQGANLFPKGGFNGGRDITDLSRDFSSPRHLVGPLNTFFPRRHRRFMKHLVSF